jgi:hypothetical protein
MKKTLPFCVFPIMVSCLVAAQMLVLPSLFLQNTGYYLYSMDDFQELVSGMVKYDLENNDFGGKE